MRMVTTTHVMIHWGEPAKINFDFSKTVLSDVEVEDDENEEETVPAVKKLETLHKRTGAPLTEIEMNTDELKIPPADFVAQVAAGDETENAMEE